MRRKITRGCMRFIGFSCVMVGLGGVAGAIETERGFLASILIMAVGIVLEYIDLRILD